MKKLFLLIMLLPVIYFSAQVDAISISGPGQIMLTKGDVYGTTWGQCIGVCTNQCMEAKRGTREECDKICTDECHPQPDVITKKIPPVSMPLEKPMPTIQPKPVACDDRKSGADCRSFYEQCVFGFNDCKKSGLDISECRKILGNCVDSCAKPVQPQRCEDRCMLIIEECLKAGVDEAVCRLKVNDCVRQCHPERQPETKQVRLPERTNTPSVRETGEISLLGRIWHIFTR